MNIYDTMMEAQTDQVLKLFAGPAASAPEVDAREAEEEPAFYRERRRCIRAATRIMDALRGAAVFGTIIGIAMRDLTSVIFFALAALVSLAWRP